MEADSVAADAAVAVSTYAKYHGRQVASVIWLSDRCFVPGVQRQQAKETELRHEVVELQGRERTAQSEVESKNQDIESVQRELGRLKGGPCRARPIRQLDSFFAPVNFSIS